MKTNVSELPAKKAGERIHDLLRNNKDKPTLLLLSGGSALEVLPFISTYVLGPNLVIGTTDDRYTRSQEGNTFSQIQKTDFYKQAEKNGARFINSFPLETESSYAFVKRLQDDLNDFFNTYPENYSIGLFGIGEDGHTASIFPAPENEFNELYRIEEPYIESKANNSAYEQRVTITPMIIEEVLDDVILYATGANKCNTVLQYMHTNTFKDHQLPILIPARHQNSELFTDCKELT